MNRQQWIDLAVTRLRAQWPHVCDEQLREVAADLHDDPEHSGPDPVRAVVEWLQLGALRQS